MVSMGVLVDNSVHAQYCSIFIVTLLFELITFNSETLRLADSLPSHPSRHARASISKTPLRETPHRDNKIYIYSNLFSSENVSCSCILRILPMYGIPPTSGKPFTQRFHFTDDLCTAAAYKL